MMFIEQLSNSAQRVQAALERMGVSFRVVELPSSTRTAQEAAQAIGCALGQIAKSLIFQAQNTGQAVLVIASGSNRVDETLIELKVGEKIIKPGADFVRQITGYTIGGVPPVGHSHDIETYIDEDLLDYDEIWAAAGTPRAVFRLTGKDMIKLTQGIVLRVTS